MSRLTRAVVLLTTALLALVPVAAHAAWVFSSHGTGTATATHVGPTAAPTAVKDGAKVSLAWEPVTLASGASVDGYEVLRHAGDGAGTPVCTATAPATTCEDTDPMMGSVSYGLVALKGARWVGQESPLTSFRFDTAAPTTTLSRTPAANGAGWNNQNVDVTFAAADSEAGVASVSYSVNGGPSTVVNDASTGFQVNAEGDTTISYFATDQVGNTESARTSTLRLDKTAPSASATASPAPNGSGVNTGPVTVSITGADGLSRVAGITYQVGAQAPVVTAGESAAVVISANGTTTVTYWATDLAGNASPQQTQTVTINNDTTAPVLTITDPVNGIQYKNNSGSDGWLRNCGAEAGGICGTSSDGVGAGAGVASVRFQLRDAVANTCWNGTTYGACTQPGLTANGTTSWAYPIAFAVIQGRSLTLTVTVTDHAGNITTDVRTFSGRP